MIATHISVDELECILVLDFHRKHDEEIESERGRKREKETKRKTKTEREGDRKGKREKGRKSNKE